MQALSVDAAAFRRDLFSDGLLIEGGAPGIVHRSLRFEQLVTGVSALFSRAMGSLPTLRLQLSPVQTADTLERNGYVTTFPQLTGLLAAFDGDEADVPDLARAAADGEKWKQHFAPSDLALCGAACHGLYPIFEGERLPDGGRYCDVEAWCFRREPSDDPARLQSFRMRELVYLGEPDAAQHHRDEWLQRCTKLFTDLGLEVHSDRANDPFFGRGAALLAAGQRDRSLKLEVLAPIALPEPTAIASSNYHEDHFGATYAITSSSGEVAHTACTGIGLDRAALALLRRHGPVLEEWPCEVRDPLGLSVGAEAPW